MENVSQEGEAEEYSNEQVARFVAETSGVQQEVDIGSNLSFG